MARVSSLEENFKREFKENVKKVGDKNIYRVPLPKSVDTWNVSKAEMYAIKGIELGHKYSGLNQTIVKGLPRGSEAKRRIIDKVHHSFKKDLNGDYLYEDYPVPSGSIVLRSTTDLNLKFSDYIAPSADGFGYIDFVNLNGIKEYLYVVPKQYVYKVDQTALALSVRSMNSYNGSGYLTWGHGTIFLYVIPYKPNRSYDATRILKTKYNTDYSREINEIEVYWQNNGVLPNIELSTLYDGTVLCKKPVNIIENFYEPVEELPLNEKEIYNEVAEEHWEGGSSITD